MIKNLILVGAGGAIGSIMRYLVNIRMLELDYDFPWPTYVVNMAGSLLIGILMALSIRENTLWRLLLITGFCGGFTTFSTFSLENLELIKNGNHLSAFAYAISSLIGGLLAVAAGFFITQKLIQ